MHLFLCLHDKSIIVFATMIVDDLSAGLTCALSCLGYQAQRKARLTVKNAIGMYLTTFINPASKT